MEKQKFSTDFSLPPEWLQVLAHSSTKDKASLLMKLKYEMTVDDLNDLIEYQEYENWMSWEESRRQQDNNK